MKHVLPVILIATLILSCGRKSNQTEVVEEVATTAPVATDTTFTLTAQQRAEGWRILFDGKTLDGWRFFHNLPNDSWEASEGALHCKPFVDGRENNRSDIITKDEFENFELAFDWKISSQGNSGVMFRVTEDFKQPYFSGPELQLIDDIGVPGDLKDVQHSGATYDMYAPEGAIIKPAGEWNTARLVVNGKHVEHWVNGVQVLSYDIGSADWIKHKNGSKWKDEAGYGNAKSGHIDLQDHNNEAWFRNIIIRKL